MWACPVGGHGNTFCPRRAAKNGNGNTFCPRRAAEGRGERQRQHLLSAKGHEEHLYWSTWGRENTFLVHIGLRRTLFGPLRTPFLIGEGHFLLPFLGRAGSLSMLTGEGTHKGCPYGWIICAHGRKGHPQGVPLRLDYWCAHGGRARTWGAPTVGLFARTRGAPTRFRQPQWGQMECGGGVALWVGRQLAKMATNWRRGVFLEGGVAGGIPPHKGGPKARPPK